MRTVSAIVLVMSALLQSRNQPYVGTWAAEQGGQIFVRLELATANDTLGGRISLADIHIDPRGDVGEVLSALGQPTPVIDLAWRNQTLTFAHKQGDDIDRFENTLSAMDALTCGLYHRTPIGKNWPPTGFPIRNRFD